MQPEVRTAPRRTFSQPRSVIGPREPELLARFISSAIPVFLFLFLRI